MGGWLFPFVPCVGKHQANDCYLNDTKNVNRCKLTWLSFQKKKGKPINTSTKTQIPATTTHSLCIRKETSQNIVWRLSW